METKGTRIRIVAAKACGKKAQLKKGFLVCPGATGRVSFGQDFQLTFQLVKRTKPKEFSATRKQPHTKAATKVVQGEQGSS